MNHTNNNKPTSSLIKFANMLAGVAAIFAAPLISKYVHIYAVNYLSKEFAYDYAYVGAWLLVALLIGCCYYGLSTLIQVLIFKLSQPRRDNF